MSIVGGLMGIAIGVTGSLVLSSYGNLPSSISLQAIIMSFVFAAFVGIFFGLYPAWKAAESNVIDALRYE
jgi:ABC-type antimicrobial peptide transport system permease subunit